jgi:hypothetical protein
MSIWRLIAKEILHRKLSFGLGVASVAVAVGCLVAELTLLRRTDLRTEAIIAAKEAETHAQMQALEDDYRKITLKLGFNVLILPKDQNLADLYADDYASKLMPEGYAERLARSRIVTINHVLPILQQKLKWRERDRTIILIGTRGELPLAQRDGQKPLLVAVPPGTMVMGYELHRSLGLKVGDHVALLGKEFVLSKCHPERGTKDDITIWVDLREAQQLLGMRGQINAILALSCHCEGPRLPGIRKEIAGILPETQVIEFESQAIARAEARDRAAAAARDAIEAERAGRARIRREREAFAAVLVPLVIIGCTVWIGFLAFGNARDRSSEIGILRAIGLRSSDVLLLFLARAMLIGLIGALLGYGGGFAVGVAWRGGAAQAGGSLRLLDVRLLGSVFVLAPVLSGLASWVPAMMAAQQDPAVVLREG